MSAVVIENREKPWEGETIAFEEIIQLGGWTIEEGVVAMHHDGTERHLEPGARVPVADHQGFKRKPFALMVEGKLHGWHKETITVEEIAKLGGWDVSVGVIEVDEETNAERTLEVIEIITVHPHPHHEHHHHHPKGYGKKHRWKRG